MSRPSSTALGVPKTSSMPLVTSHPGVVQALSRPSVDPRANAQSLRPDGHDDPKIPADVCEGNFEDTIDSLPGKWWRWCTSHHKQLDDQGVLYVPQESDICALQCAKGGRVSC